MLVHLCDAVFPVAFFARGIGCFLFDIIGLFLLVIRCMKCLLPLSFIIAVSSCAPQSKPWTADQKAKMGNIQLASVTAEADAYQEPSGVGSQSGPVPVPVGVDPIAAAVGLTLGSLVVKGIEANANSQFEKNFASSLQTINRTAPTNIAAAVTPTWQKEVRAVNFVKKRLGAGGSTLSLHISDYGLANATSASSVYADKSNNKYVVAVNGTLTLTNAQGKKMLEAPVSGFSQGFSYSSAGGGRSITPGAGSTIQEWASRPERLRTHVKLAAADIARDCAQVIAEKAAE